MTMAGQISRKEENLDRLQDQRLDIYDYESRHPQSYALRLIVDRPQRGDEATK